MIAICFLEVYWDLPWENCSPFPFQTLLLYDLSLPNITKLALYPKHWRLWKMDCSCHFARVDQKSTSKCSNVFARTVKVAPTFIKQWTLMLGGILFCNRICIPTANTSSLGWILRRRGLRIIEQIAWTHILLLGPTHHFSSKFSIVLFFKL